MLPPRVSRQTPGTWGTEGPRRWTGRTETRGAGGAFVSCPLGHGPLSESFKQRSTVTLECLECSAWLLGREQIEGKAGGQRVQQEGITGEGRLN